MDEVMYTKEQLLKAKKFAKQKDLVSAVLKNDERYTIEQTEKLIRKYLKGKVN